MNLHKIPTLSPEKRQAARDRAIGIVYSQLGDEPKQEAFKHHSFSSLPPRFRELVTRLSWLALAAAFFLSASRLFQLGYQHAYKESQMDNFVAVLLGFLGGAAVVILAEISQLIFLLAFADEDKGLLSRAVLVLGASIATLIALFGNYESAVTVGLLNTGFDFLMTFAPPCIVLGIGWVMKDEFLKDAKRRQAVQTAFQEALFNYHTYKSHPETYTGWQQLYASALRDEYLRTFGSRKFGEQYGRDLLPTLTDSQWSHLILRELRQTGWYQDDTEQPVVVAQKEEAGTNHAVQIFPLQASFSLNGNGAKATHHEGYDV